jgi:hypothetical protein
MVIICFSHVVGVILLLPITVIMLTIDVYNIHLHFEHYGKLTLHNYLFMLILCKANFPF